MQVTTVLGQYSNIVDGVEYPVAFASRVLTPAECRYSTTKREALAVIQAMKWFKPYIWGTQFVLRTDHASLQWLFRQNNDGMIFRMLQRLQEFDFQVVHRPGDKHGNADGLSRQCSITPELTEAERLDMFGSCPSANSLEDALGRINLVTAEDTTEPMSIQFQEDVNSLRLAQRHDPCLCLILQWANAEKHPDQNPLRDLKIKKANAIAQGEDEVAMWGLWDQMELTDGVLYRKWHVEGSNTTQKQLVVPQGLRETVLEQLHDSKLSGGHFAFQKTLDRARQRFWWPNTRKDIERKCENCTVSSTKYRWKEKNSPSPDHQRWDPIQQSGSRYPRSCYPSEDKRCKIHTRVDGLFYKIRGLRSLRKNYGRRCC